MENIVLVAKTLFDGVWSLLTNTYFPGTEFTLAALSIAVLFAAFATRIFTLLTGIGGGGATYGKAADAAEKAYLTHKEKTRRKIGF